MRNLASRKNAFFFFSSVRRVCTGSAAPSRRHRKRKSLITPGRMSIRPLYGHQEPHKHVVARRLEFTIFLLQPGAQMPRRLLRELKKLGLWFPSRLRWISFSSAALLSLIGEKVRYDAEDSHYSHFREYEWLPWCSLRSYVCTYLPWSVTI